MIQFNLLPDVKLQYVKARRLHRLVMLTSIAAAAAGLAILVLMFILVIFVQKKHLNDLSTDITAKSKQLSSTQDLDKILTIQNQLTSLSGLHDKKPVTSRIFGYAQQVTPSKVSISNLTLDFAAGTIDIKGNADAISTVNTFADTLKFTKFTLTPTDTTQAASKDQKNAFSDVVLSSFGRDDKGASYDITLKFDPLIFDSANTVTLVVPKIVTTRSETEKPSDIFQAQTTGGNQ